MYSTLLARCSPFHHPPSRLKLHDSLSPFCRSYTPTTFPPLRPPLPSGGFFSPKTLFSYPPPLSSSSSSSPFSSLSSSSSTSCRGFILRRLDPPLSTPRPSHTNFFDPRRPLNFEGSPARFSKEFITLPGDLAEKRFAGSGDGHRVMSLRGAWTTRVGPGITLRDFRNAEFANVRRSKSQGDASPWYSRQKLPFPVPDLHRDPASKTVELIGIFLYALSSEILHYF